LRPPDAAERALPPGAQGPALPLCISFLVKSCCCGCSCC
jgi:hypothetical protein